jgi:hypothetical protein
VSVLPEQLHRFEVDLNSRSGHLMTQNQKKLARIGLGFLTVLELVSIYQVLFCLWMTAHPLYDLT